MAGSATLAARNAVYAALNGNASITAMAQVYQIPPDNMSFPYVDIPSATEVIDDTFAGTNSNGREVTLSINVWSEEKEDDEVNLISNLVVETLNWASLSLGDGWNFTSINLENSVSRLSENYRQIQTRFRIRCNK